MKTIKLYTGLALIVLLIAGSITAVFAQTPTGQIAGRVVDKQTGERLPGVNVVVRETTFGAATDMNGEFRIIHVPVGTYEVQFSMIGFQTIVVEDVRVRMDGITRLDMQLEETFIEVDAVVVTAERPVIERDRTASSYTIEARDIERAPIEGLRQIMELSAGIMQNPDGTYAVRGGGKYELNFMINNVEQISTNTGVPGYSFAWDKGNTSWKYDFNPLGVEQMEVVIGGFSAEYGNAQSGVVKVATREGGRTFSAEGRMEYRPPGKYHWGPYLYGEETFEHERWGTREAWDATFPDSSDRWKDEMFELWKLNHLPGPDNPYGVYDYRQLAYTRYMIGVGGPLGGDPEKLRFFFSGEYREDPTRIPTIERTMLYQNATLTTSYIHNSENRFKLMGMYQYYRGGLFSGAEDIRWAGRDGRWKYQLTTDSPREERTVTGSMTWTFTPSARTVFELTSSLSRETYVVLVRPIVQRTDPRSIPPGPWDHGFRRPYSFTTLYQQDAKTDFMNVSADLTTQLTTNILFKAGGRFQYYDTYYSAVSSFAANAFITRTGYAEFYEAQPMYFAGYVQTRMDFEGMVANIGLRFDGYNFNAPFPADRFNPFYQAVGAEATGDPRTRTPGTYTSLLPRIGLSFPIGERTAFRLQYGHFSSMPTMKQALMRTTELGWIGYGNPDLEPSMTVSYEFGVQHRLDETHRLDIVGYYNDRLRQVGTIRIAAPTAGIRREGYYTSYTNNAHGVSRGIEVTFDKAVPGTWGYRLSYAWSQTTFGNFGPSRIYSEDPDDPRNYQQRMSATEFLSFDDRTHSFRTLLIYNAPYDSGPEILGFAPFGGWTISFIYHAQSGAPYTYTTSYDEYLDVINNRRYPLESKFDMNFNREIKIGDTHLNFGMRIINLFNNRWLTPMGSQDDIRNWVERGVTIADPADDPDRASHRYDYFRAFRNTPRQVFFTIGFGF